MRWNGSAQEIDAALAAAQAAAAQAATAQATADAAAPGDRFAFVPLPGLYTRLTHLPHEAGALDTITAEAGRIYYFPCSPLADLTIGKFALEQVNTPVGTTLTASFALYTETDLGLPIALQADWSADPIAFVNGPPATLVSADLAAPVTIPAGLWWLAVLFLGTNGVTPPVVRAVAGHPLVAPPSGSGLAACGAYRSDGAANAAFPGGASTDFAAPGLPAPLVFGRRA